MNRAVWGFIETLEYGRIRGGAFYWNIGFVTFVFKDESGILF